MTIVLVILALVAGLVLTRAPQRGGVVDLRAASSLTAGALRVARSRAIANNRIVPVRFDPASESLQVEGETQRRLPTGIRIAAAPTILFRPDGSSNGGVIELAGRASAARIGVSWLTGRVVVAASDGLRPDIGTDSGQ